LACTLSVSSGKDKEVVFGAIFFIIWFGSIMVTLNAQLLEAKVTFFSSLCLLGYCVFPMNLAALAVAITKAFLPFWAKLIIIAVGFVWSTFSSKGFMSALVADNKK
jgi:hypothetical protein